MNQERLMKIILAPVISEKATLVGEMHRQVVFEVVPDATKAEIKAAVELLFKEQKDGARKDQAHLGRTPVDGEGGEP